MSDLSKESNNFKKPGDMLALDEIHRLINSPVATKIDIAQNVAKYYKQGKYEDNHTKIAEQVFRTLLEDTEVKVRKSLAESVKDIGGIPHDVVVALAKDIAEVSLPVLEFSDVLTDIDLVDIISSAESEQQHLAITKRHKIPEKVSEALINTQNERVVDNLVQNKGAEVSEKGFSRIVENYSNSEAVLGSMIERGSLPVTVVERLTGTLTNELYKKLSVKHKSAMDKLEEAIKKGRDMATMQIMGLKSSEEEFREFMVLMKNLKMSEELIPISALCIANLNLFEISVAKRIRVPVINIRELLKDRSNQGFKALYNRSSLPAHLYNATVFLLDVIRDYSNNITNENGLRLSTKSANRLIELLITKAEEIGKPDGLDYLLSLIKHNADK